MPWAVWVMVAVLGPIVVARALPWPGVYAIGCLWSRLTRRFSHSTTAAASCRTGGAVTRTETGSLQDLLNPLVKKCQIFSSNVDPCG